MNRYLFRILNMVQKPDLLPLGMRRWLLTRMGILVSPSAVVLSGIHFVQGAISIGDRAFINHGCLIEGAGGVDIGDRAHLAHRCMILTTSHEIGADPNNRAFGMRIAQIRIGAGSWLGAGTTVINGVTIGRGVVIAAGAVVHRDVADNTLAGGVPVKSMRSLETGGA